jgi:hypothetical protein
MCGEAEPDEVGVDAYVCRRQTSACVLAPHEEEGKQEDEASAQKPCPDAQLGLGLAWPSAHKVESVVEYSLDNVRRQGNAGVARSGASLRRKNLGRRGK